MRYRLKGHGHIIQVLAGDLEPVTLNGCLEPFYRVFDGKPVGYGLGMHPHHEPCRLVPQIQRGFTPLESDSQSYNSAGQRMTALQNRLDHAVIKGI